MKGKLIIVAVLVFLFAGFVGFRFFVVGKQNVYGMLKVVSTPTASIFIDNVAIGRNSFDDKYKAGEYILKLIPEGAATDTASWQKKIKVYEGAMTYVNIELGSSDITTAGNIFTISKTDQAKSGDRGEIFVETDPLGAIVTLDNEEKGIAPLVLTDVLKGEHEISVFMPGFFQRREKINVVAKRRLNTYFKLALDQSQVTPTKPTGEKEATNGASLKKVSILIKDTPTGWLRVRQEPTLDASESGKVNPGEKYPLLDEREGWYKIKMASQEGWISSTYSEKEK